MSQISIALIGVGGFGKIHLNSLKTLASENLVHLTAVADPTLDSMPEVREQLKASRIHIYQDYREMLEKENGLQAVTIVTPIPYHYEMVRYAIQKGLYIYLEKPATPRIQDLRELIALDMNQKVHVGFQQITTPWMQQLKNWIISGKLGTIQSIRLAACWPRPDSYYARAGWAGKMTFRGLPVFDGPATNALAHLIHDLMYLQGNAPDTFGIPLEVRGELYRARAIESYDTVSLAGKFPSGTTFSAAFTHATEKLSAFQIKVQGTAGWAAVSDDGSLLESSLGNADYRADMNKLQVTTYYDFLDLVRGKRKKAVTSLADTEGYTLTTNGLWLSAGTSHAIPSASVRKYAASADAGYDVTGLSDAVAASLSDGLLFSDRKIPWAVASKTITLKEINQVSF